MRGYSRVCFAKSSFGLHTYRRGEDHANFRVDEYGRMCRILKWDGRESSESETVTEIPGRNTGWESLEIREWTSLDVSSRPARTRIIVGTIPCNVGEHPIE